MSQDDAERAIESFAKDLISKVRDKSIQTLDLTLKGQYKADKSQQMYQDHSNLPPSCQDFISQIISHTVDQTIYNFIWLFHEYRDDYSIQIKGSIGQKLDLAEKANSLIHDLYFWLEDHSAKRMK